ncbi:MAG: hypothetical protein AAFO69_06050 [Bacteroidota bacterium]
MFLRKLFSSKNKLLWVLLDLLIVIIGVYCAFLIQRYSENSKNEKEQTRIIKALKYEIEVFRYQMYQTSSYAAKTSAQLKELRKKDVYRDFSDYRFIEPQYDYQTLEYALNLQNAEIIDFQLNNLLQSLLVEIRKIEHAERLLTEVAAAYRTVPKALSAKSETYLLMHSNNMDLFDRFIIFIEDRSIFANRIFESSVRCLKEIDDHLGTDTAKSIEEELIRQKAPSFDSEEIAVKLGLQLFPKFSEEEMRTIYRDARKKAGR